MASVAEQLRQLQFAQPRPQRVASVPSFLFDENTAAAMSVDQVTALASSGLAQLLALEASTGTAASATSLEPFRSLFAPSAAQLERETQTAEEAAQLDKRLAALLQRLSPHLMLPAAHKALEMLVRVYKVHVYNIVELLACALPYHNTKVFVRLVQLLQLGQPHINPRWGWLRSVQKQRLPLDRALLIDRCASDEAFLKFVCAQPAQLRSSRLPAAATAKPLALYTSLLGGLAARGMADTNLLLVIPSLDTCLCARRPDFAAAAHVVIAQLAAANSLAADLVLSLIATICKTADSANIESSLSCLLALYHTQEAAAAHELPRAAVLALAAVPDLATQLQALEQRFRLAPFLDHLLRRLLALAQPGGDVSADADADADADAAADALVALLERVRLTSAQARLVFSLQLEIFLAGHAAKPKKKTALHVLRERTRAVLAPIDVKHASDLDAVVSAHLESAPEASQALQEFAQMTLGGTRFSATLNSSMSLFLSLKHPEDKIRAAAVESLAKLVASHKADSETASADGEFFETSILSALADSSMEVVRSALQHLGPVLVKLVPTPALYDALSALFSRQIDQRGSGEVIFLAVTKLGELAADEPERTDAIAELLLPRLLVTKARRRLVEALVSGIAASPALTAHPTLKGLATLSSSKEWKSLTASKHASDMGEANRLLYTTLAATLADDSVFETYSRMLSSMTAVVSRRGIAQMLPLLLTAHTACTTAQPKHPLPAASAMLCARLVVASAARLLAHCPLRLLRRSSTSVAPTPADILACAQPLAKLKPGQDAGDADEHSPLATLAQLLVAALGRLASTLTTGPLAKTPVDLSALTHLSSPSTATLLRLDLAAQFAALATPAASLGLRAVLDTIPPEHMLAFLAGLWTVESHPPLVRAAAARLAANHLSSQPAATPATSLVALLPAVLLALADSHAAVRQVALALLNAYARAAAASGGGKCAPLLPLLTHLQRAHQDVLSDSANLSQALGSAFSSPTSPPEQTMAALVQATAALAQAALTDRAMVLLRHCPPALLMTQGGLALLQQLLDQDFASLDAAQRRLLSRLLAMLPPELAGSPAAARALAAALEDHDGDDMESPQACAVRHVLSAEYAAAMSKTQRKEVFARLVTLLRAQAGRAVADSLREALSRIRISAVAFVDVLNQSLAYAREAEAARLQNAAADIDDGQGQGKRRRRTSSASGSSAGRRPRRKSSSSSAVTAATAAATPATEAACLEWVAVFVDILLFKDLNTLNQPQRIMAPLFDLLSMAQAAQEREPGSAEHIMQSILQAILRLSQLTHTAPAANNTDDKKTPKKKGSKIRRSSGAEAMEAEEAVAWQEDHFDLGLIVQCVRHSRSPQTHRLALSLLARVAQLFPRRVLESIMPIFTFMGASVLRQDDGYSLGVIQQTIESIVPVLVTEGRADEQATTVIPMLRVFVDSYEHIPRHRCQPLYTLLLQTLGARDFLGPMVALLLAHGAQHIRGSASASAQTPAATPARTPARSQPATPAARADAGAGAGAATPSNSTSSISESLDAFETFVQQLVHRFSLMDQMTAALWLMRLLVTVPVETEAETKKRRMAGGPDPGAVMRSPELPSPHVYYERLLPTGKQLRLFKFRLAQFLSQLLASPGLLEKVVAHERRAFAGVGAEAESEAEQLRALYLQLVQQVLTFAEALEERSNNNNSSSNSGRGRGSALGDFVDVLRGRVYEIMDLVNALLSTPDFVELIGTLITHRQTTLRRKALLLFNERVSNRHTRGGGSAQDKLFLGMVDRLLPLVQQQQQQQQQGGAGRKTPKKSGAAAEEDAGNAVMTRQTALLSLNILIANFGQSAKESFVGTVPAVLEALETPHAELRASALICLGTLVAELDVLLVPSLPRLMPHVLAGVQAEGPAVLVQGAINTVMALLRRLPQFCGPHLAELLDGLTQPRFAPRAYPDPSASWSRAHECRTLMARSVPLRLLLPAEFDCFMAVLNGAGAAAGATIGGRLVRLQLLLQVLAATVDAADRSQIAAHYKRIFKFFLDAMDLRARLGPEASVDEEHQMEESGMSEDEDHVSSSEEEEEEEESDDEEDEEEESDSDSGSGEDESDEEVEDSAGQGKTRTGSEAKRSLAEELETTESLLLDTVVGFVLKLSEAVFRPLYLKLVEWATGAAGTPRRVLMLYQLADRLAATLKRLFVGVGFGPLLKHAAEMLAAPTVAGGPALAGALVDVVLSSLGKCFQFDDMGFVNRERFEMVMPPLVGSLSPLPGEGEAAYLRRIETQLAPCIGHLAVAIGREAQWKPLNVELLRWTRNDRPLVRRGALLCMTELYSRLGDEFMGLWPETITYLAELLEDDNEEVERAARVVVAKIESFLGESLERYL